MMEAHVLEAREVLSFIDRVGTQGLEAAILGTNRTVEEGLSAIRDVMRANMIIREPRMLPPHQLPKAWRATKNSLEARMQLGDNEGLGVRRRQVFSKFEEGGDQSSRDPVNWPFAVPTEEVRPTPQTKIPSKLLPRNLVGRFDKVGLPGKGHLGTFLGLGRKANVQTRFKKLKSGGHGVYHKQVGRYFVLGRPGDRHYGLYERTGPGDKDVVLLYHFAIRRTNPPLLQWEKTANRIAETRFAANIEGALEVVLRGDLK